MKKEFVLSKVVDGEESGRVVFSADELKALMQGLYYAKVKEMGGRRKAVYVAIYSRLWEVVGRG